jgi:phenylpropionate dioxygenase-like ring-hydroxylating dioxygenase large terminal subunit
MPLSEARCEFPGTISCAFHGWTFELASGKLVAALTDGPDSAVVGTVHLKTYPAVERKGVVWAFIGDGAPPPLEADMPAEFFDPDMLVFGAPAPALLGNWRMAIEGSLDPSHAFYMHRTSSAMTLTRLPAARGRHFVEYEENKLTYRTDPPTMQADYPGLGRWPREPFWKRPGRMGFKVTGWLPASVVVNDWPSRGMASYNIHVPVDDNHWRYFHFQVAKVSGPLKRLWYRLRHALIWGPFIQGNFLGQDKWACRLTTPFYNEHDGWNKERLYRPDVVVIAWRRFVEANARGFKS